MQTCLEQVVVMLWMKYWLSEMGTGVVEEDGKFECCDAEEVLVGN